MSNTRWVQVGALLLCGAFVFSASRLQPGINAGRKQLNLLGSESVLENTPPEYAFAVQAFGAFRGLLTNIAFMRAEDYKQQGRYYDAYQLGKWICDLQPRFPVVWEYVSWNMAWNISVTTYTPQERWNWVYNGVRLARDDGLRFNPRAFNLYKQIAWIFTNKMGEVIDDYHMAYKSNWAWRMHLLLGPPPPAVDAVDEAGKVEPLDLIDNSLTDAIHRAATAEDAVRKQRSAQLQVDYVDRKPPSAEDLQKLDTLSESFESQAARRAASEFIRAIADAPKSLEELTRRNPEAAERIAQLRDIGVSLSDSPLAEDAYWNTGGLAWTFFERYRKLKDPPSIVRAFQSRAKEEPQDPDLQRFGEILGVAAGDPAGLAILRTLQRKVLSEVYKLDPAHMAFVVQEFGAMDWRYVDAHALYWVTLALIRGGEALNTFTNDRVNTARLMFFSLRNLWSRGHITFEPDAKNPHLSYLDMTPELNLVEAMHQAYLRYGKWLDPQPEENEGVGNIYRIGHVNFLTEAIRALYLRDREAEAMHYYTYLANVYGRKPNGELEMLYLQTLDDFVMKNFYENMESYRDAQVNVGDLLQFAYAELADGQVSRYNKVVKRALDVWKTYMEDKNRDLSERRKLLPFEDIQKDVLRFMLGVPSGSQTMLVNKAKLWRNAPPTMKRWVYDDLRDILRQECDIYGFDVDKAFNEPAGMPEFRKQHPVRVKPKPDDPVETTVQPSRQ